MAAPPKPLTPQQTKFVELYVGGLSATEAYVQAGYKATRAAARTNAARLLANARVESAVEAARQKGADQAGVNAEYVVTRLKREANRKKNSGAARVKALELLGRTINLFPTTTRLEGGDPAKPVRTANEHHIDGPDLDPADLREARRLVGDAGARVPDDHPAAP